MKYASVSFRWNKEKTFDYIIPHGLELAPGDKVIVETRKGETEVEVVEIRDASDKAEKQILRKVEPVEPAPTGTNPEDEWNF